MCGRPSTTIGFERLFNPLARLERQQFVAAVEEGVPARPLNMVAIEATNRGVAELAWAMPTTAADVDEVSVDALEAERASPDSTRTIVVDVREPEEYAQGHIPGALNVPQAELATRLEEIPRDRPVYTVCRSGFRSLRAAQFLKQLGFSHVLNVAGGTEAWLEAGKPASTTDDANTAASGPQVHETRWTHAGIHAGAA